MYILHNAVKLLEVMEDMGGGNRHLRAALMNELVFRIGKAEIAQAIKDASILPEVPLEYSSNRKAFVAPTPADIKDIAAVDGKTQVLLPGPDDRNQGAVMLKYEFHFVNIGYSCVFLWAAELIFRYW